MCRCIKVFTPCAAVYHKPHLQYSQSLDIKFKKKKKYWNQIPDSNPHTDWGICKREDKRQKPDVDPKFTTEEWALMPSLDGGRLDTDEPFCWEKFEPSFIIPPPRPSLHTSKSSGLHLSTGVVQSLNMSPPPAPQLQMPSEIIYRAELALSSFFFFCFGLFFLI